ncbi:hypothetical protein [Paenibacillus sp. FSL W7-1287]|uniref:hypothetical protein n=1 Tax=Paenibacillus sp. FSL W7-1287 TaxID=2954538 RepID=UPI0030F62102
MKRKQIGFMIGIFFIVAFIAIIVATVLIVQKVIEDEQYKQSYYASLYGLDQKDSNVTNTPVKFPAQSYASEPDTPQYKAIQLIRELHNQADLHLLGNKMQKYAQGSDEGWSDILESELLNADNYASISEAFAEEEDIVNDMNNLLALHEIAVSQYEPNALRYMHRILHDLDLYGYPEPGDTAYDYWGATHAVASSNPTQLNEIIDFITNNKPSS